MTHVQPKTDFSRKAPKTPKTPMLAVDGRFARALPVLAASLWILAACDGAVPAVDASTPVSAHASAVSLRIDVSSDKPAASPASLTVLAFRAAFSGMAAGEVLGMVDPLAADAPTHDCQVRDVDLAAAALVARGDAIELEELAGIGVSVSGDSGVDIRPSPRLYPDLAATIGGVVGEAGPIGLASVPEEIRVRGGITTAANRNASPDSPPKAAGDLSGDLAAGESGRSPDLAIVGVPATGWIRTVNGTVPSDGMLIPIGADLNLNLTPAEVTETSIEIRPFGATVALTCAVPLDSVAAGGQIPFVISRQALDALASAARTIPGAPIAAALDLVRRSGKQMPLSATRVSLEVRTSTFVELRP